MSTSCACVCVCESPASASHHWLPKALSFQHVMNLNVTKMALPCFLLLTPRCLWELTLQSASGWASPVSSALELQLTRGSHVRTTRPHTSNNPIAYLHHKRSSWNLSLGMKLPLHEMPSPSCHHGGIVSRGRALSSSPCLLIKVKTGLPTAAAVLSGGFPSCGY